MYAEERQQEIIELARDAGRVAVADLASRFSVTSETIRRDLDALAALGLVSRVHGGAVPAESLRFIEETVERRAVTSPAEKDRIARRAIALLPEREGLTVLLDAGTTTARLCGLLPDTVSVVITNSVPAAAVLSSRTDLDVRVLGGSVRAVTQAIVGAAAYEEVLRLRVDIAFLGTNGFSVDHGFSTPDPNEARIKEAMVRSAREVVVLSDSSKWGRDHLVRFASLDQADALVTDAALSDAAAQALRATGLRVEIAE